MKRNYLYLLLLFVFFTNCGKDKNKLVDKDLAVYVDRFFAEADLREMDVSDDNLEVVFKDLTYRFTESRNYPEFFLLGFS